MAELHDPAGPRNIADTPGNPATDGPVVGEPWTLSAVELRRSFIRRDLSPVEVLDAIFARITALNPQLNAFVTLTEDLAREQALEAERLYMNAGSGRAARGGTDSGMTGAQSGDTLPPLLGIPVSIKDNLATRGIRTTMGSRLFADWVPDTDAVIAQRVRDAGAVVLGKTNTSEFGWKCDAGNMLFGPTFNPWRLERSSGGSSGGGAAAVSTGLGPIALGTDGAGSLRLPGSYCGVIGYKPSQGTVPVGPRGGIGTMSHHGLLARTVGDVALVLDVAAGPDPRDRLCDGRQTRYFKVASPARRLAAGTPDADDPYQLLGLLGPPDRTALHGLRVAWSPTLGYAQPEPRVSALAAASAYALAELGAEVAEIDPGLEDPHEQAWLIFEIAQATQHARELDRVRDLLDPGRLAVVEDGMKRSAVELGRAMAMRDALHQQLVRFMTEWDVLITPTMPETAFPVGLDRPESYAGESTHGFLWTPYTYPFNLTGQPAISLPCGVLDGLPVGVQIVGRWRDDETVLRVAAAIEALQPWPPLAPLVS